MEIKNKVEQILLNRKKNLEKIEEKSEFVRQLSKNVREIRKIAEELKNDEVKNILPAILDSQNRLDSAIRKIDDVKTRFRRDYVTVGISGTARVGKSTLLQKLTGLGDDQIPTGSGQPVTACRSRIFNQDESSLPYATVQFFTPQEFLEKRVETEAEGLGFDFISVDDFADADFSVRFAADDELSVSKNKRMEKLALMQKSFQFYESLLGSSDKTITNLSELKNYVAYSSTDENRLYPAVKNVDIFCHFPALDGVKLRLLDLPGFGEVGGVDRIQIDGLQGEIDHAIVVLRPIEGDSWVNQRYSEMSKVLHSIQSDVHDRTNLMSYSMNVYKGLSNADALAESMEKDLERNDPTVVSGKNIYKFCALDEKSVSEMFLEIVGRMVDALPQMDADFLDAYKKNIDFASLEESLVKIDSLISESMKTVYSESSELSNMARHIRECIDFDYKKILNGDGIVSSDELCEYVDAIKAEVESEIKNDLMFRPTDYYKSWNEYVELKSTHSTGNVYNEQRDVLRSSVVAKYEKLNRFYLAKVDEFKSVLVEIFRKHTGNLLSDNKESEAAIDEIVEKLEAARPETDILISAFKWLKGVNLDFRQSVYPYIFDSESRRDLENDFFSESFSNKNEKEKIQLVKDLLTTRLIAFNVAMRDEIIDNDITERFLQSSMEHFRDLLIVKNDDDKVENAFRRLVEVYSNEIMVKNSEDAKQNAMLRKLRQCADKCIDEIKKIKE